MLKPLTTAGVWLFAALSAWSQPYETATVISATPVLTQVPHQVCTPSATTEIKSDTLPTPLCTEPWMQVTAYNVEYMLNGRRYTTQMDQDPGQTLMVQMAPKAPLTASSTVVTSQIDVPPPVYVAPPQIYMAPPPIYMAPPMGHAHPYGYYPPIGFNFGIGYHSYRRH